MGGWPLSFGWGSWACAGYPMSPWLGPSCARPGSPGVRLDPTDQKPQPGLRPQTDHPLLIWNLELGSPQCPPPPPHQVPSFLSPYYVLGSQPPCPPSCFHSLNHCRLEQTSNLLGRASRRFPSKHTLSALCSRTSGGSSLPGAPCPTGSAPRVL